MSYPEKISNNLSLEERETNISIMASDRHSMLVFTDDPVTYAQLLRKGHKPSKCDGESAHFELEARFLTIRTNAPKRSGPPKPNFASEAGS